GSPAFAPSYDGAEPRNVPTMSMTRPASTGRPSSRMDASAGEAPPSRDASTRPADSSPAGGLKAALYARRQGVRAANAPAGGRATLEHYADRVDGLIRQLFTDAATYDGPLAVVALGGYGRRHLCLHSDIDLLLLFGSGIAAAEERFVHSFLNPLWDLGVVVG